VEEGVKEWKRLLKSISDDKTEVHVIRKIEEFMQSQEMKKLKEVFRKTRDDKNNCLIHYLARKGFVDVLRSQF